MIDIKKLTTQDNDFQQQLEQVLAWDASSDMAVVDTVKAILVDVKDRGDEAVL